MLLGTFKTAILASIIELSLAQEGLFGRLFAQSSEQGQLGSFGYSPLDYLLFGGSGQSREQEAPGSFGPYGYMPFGMMAPFGSLGQSGESGGAEAATEPGETPATRRPSLLDLGTMLLLNLLVSNQGVIPRYESGISAQSGPTTQNPNTNSEEITPAHNAGQNLGTDMSWMPFFLLPN